ncbi:glutamyl-tRNA(Gln) amidotransferase subunit C, mitochondrial isoform X1 [Alosa sapidissima]|uniref:glutamyl-tRNA(Gln) amidotransferase subunit C, mitochondrial isoform X1 n=1 Tax=Alosa sapidissima TaxID=34773 RepID=UPI001C08EE30|nr:glutamyl-tRNA(Gln) amidotransferase subunit C, mitochondrial isoform X1 [Alosa sapidissima]XP_041957392.1 glutamyl-tRNA(Gln) amidotransferase subunit C, mitochondrial isoform X1 [Alosa sapidissima]
MFLETIKPGLRRIPFYLRFINYQRNALVTSGSGKLVQCSNLTLFSPYFSHVKYVHNKKVPWAPKWQPVMKTQPSSAMEVRGEVVDKLERLALVDFGNQEGIDCLEKAIHFADQLHIVNSVAVEPLDSVLHDNKYVWFLNRSMHLRNDIITEGKRAEELLQLSRRVIDEYFVAPPGNIPLERK